MTPLKLAQGAIEDLKSAILQVLEKGPSEGMKNSEIGRLLNIYEGYRNGKYGHLSRTILERLKEDNKVQELPSGKWTVRRHK